MRIGILDIQGSVAEHFEALKKLDVEVVLVKKLSDFEGIAGLILPGGESTTIGKLLDWYDLKKEIVKRAQAGMPVWGTCAGAILMAKEIVGDEKTDGLGLVDVAVRRNAYGRQLESFEGKVNFGGKMIPAVFIRAPKIVSFGGAVDVLAENDGEIVAAREGTLLITTFHPELTDDLSVHLYFLEMCG